MQLIAENHSMYPRVGESEADLRLRRAHHKVDRGEIDSEQLKEVEDSYVKELIEEQEAAGLDIVTDGMIRWYDHISHLCGKISGVEVGGLVRYFDTNYLVREGLVKESLSWDEPMLVDGFEYANSVAEQPVKVILTGPYTLAYFSEVEDNCYPHTRSLAEDYAEVLRREVEALSKAGLEHLQLEVPMVLQDPEVADWVFPLLDKVMEPAGDEMEVRLTTYFGDAVPLYDEFQNSAADLLMFDFSYSPDLPEVIEQKGSEKRMSIGVLNGRNTKLAGAEAVADQLTPLLSELPTGMNSITFTSSLDYLPRDRARLKLDRLVEIRDQLQEVSV